MNDQKKLTLCVFIDALGWEVLKRHSFLDDILAVKAPLNTIFGYSSTCDPTILTGKLPREHGHFAFFAYDPKNSPFKNYRFFSILPKSIMQRGRVRGKLSQIMKRVHGFTGYFQLYNMPFKKLHLFNYTEQANIFEPGGINGGQATIFDFLKENKIPYCRPEGFNEPESVAEVARAIEAEQVTFVYLFLGRLDAILHQYGTQPGDVRCCRQHGQPPDRAGPQHLFHHPGRVGLARLLPLLRNAGLLDLYGRCVPAKTKRISCVAIRARRVLFDHRHPASRADRMELPANADLHRDPRYRRCPRRPVSQPGCGEIGLYPPRTRVIVDDRVERTPSRRWRADNAYATTPHALAARLKARPKAMPSPIRAAPDLRTGRRGRGRDTPRAIRATA